jgi:hypothetical protein
MLGHTFAYLLAWALAPSEPKCVGPAGVALRIGTKEAFGIEGFRILIFLWVASERPERRQLKAAS